jgi:alkylated DNA repair protein (DNA oxidative demethylase)
MPPGFAAIAQRSAAVAGYPDYQPNVCLINRYEPGNSMGLHQDKDERDFSQPIVSVSLGLSINFKMGGLSRKGSTTQIDLVHGDVLVFGGPARLAFHGVGKLREEEHPLTGKSRFNLTFRVS